MMEVPFAANISTAHDKRANLDSSNFGLIIKSDQIEQAKIFEADPLPQSFVG